jgi:hypothetical protein
LEVADQSWGLEMRLDRPSSPTIAVAALGASQEVLTSEQLAEATGSLRSRLNA